MRAFVVSLLIVVPSICSAQFAPDEMGELVLAHTVVQVLPVLSLPGGGPAATSSMQVWESGFVELTTVAVGLGAEARNFKTLVPVEDVQELKRDLIELGILRLDGQILPLCTVCLGPRPILDPDRPDFGPFLPPLPPQRVTFIDRVPKWIHEYLKRHPKFYERFKVHLRPREASFATKLPETLVTNNSNPPSSFEDSNTGFFVLNRISEFANATFPEAFPRLVLVPFDPDVPIVLAASD